MHQSRALKVLNTFPALAATALFAHGQAASAAATAVFSFPNGFASASSQVSYAGAARFSGSDLLLSIASNGGHQAGGAWYKTQQNITSFTTDFTFQQDPNVVGLTFCVQNTNTTHNPVYYGTNAVGDANLSGYGAYANLPSQYPLINSMAVVFDLYGQGQTPSLTANNATGLFINSGPADSLIPEVDLNPAGINLHSGDVMAAHIVYDGTLLTMTLRDTVTNAQTRVSWPVNIPAITGSNSAYVGFTGSALNAVNQGIQTWSFSTGYATRLATPTFSVTPGSYTGEQSVTLSGPSGATIYYTTNGQQPTSSSKQYTGAITVSSSEVVQAVAIESGFTDSLVATANYEIAPATTPLINFPSGFSGASGLITVNGVAKFNGTALQVTDTNSIGMETGAAWYAVPVNVQSFTTNFTLQLTSAAANGMTFTIQNQNAGSTDAASLEVTGGPNIIGNSSNGLGYQGILSSAAVIFDLYDGSGDLTGLYTDGASPAGSSTDMSSSGVSLKSGNPLNVALNYNGSTLSMTMTDSKTKATFSKSWTIDIPSTVGGNTAYVGFTGGTGGMFAQQQITAWTFSNSQSASSSGTGSTPPPAAVIPDPPTNVTVQ